LEGAIVAYLVGMDRKSLSEVVSGVLKDGAIAVIRRPGTSFPPEMEEVEKNAPTYLRIASGDEEE
jgi:hypothetical protein